jgi:arsenite methyltransferase
VIRTVDAESVKACCASFYGVDAVTLLLGESYHPGGATLTRRLADRLGLRTGERVLDVAAGIGTSAMLLATEHDVDVLGIDLGSTQVARATARAEHAGLTSRVCFQIGDAERLPVDDASVDAAICECSFCTFPDKTVAATEFARVLRPDGRLGITDVWLDPDRLDPELRGLAGRVACLADARPIAELTATLGRAGFTVAHLERHDQALADTIDQITTRLRALRIADLPSCEASTSPGPSNSPAAPPTPSDAAMPATSSSSPPNRHRRPQRPQRSVPTRRHNSTDPRPAVRPGQASIRDRALAK